MFEERLATLEKQNRRLRKLLGLLAALLAAVAALAAWPLLRPTDKLTGDPLELRTQRLVIVDQAGKPIGLFGRDANGGVLQVAGGESLVSILAGQSGMVVAQHGKNMSYLSADADICLFKISSPAMEAAVKSTLSAEETAFWVSSQGKGRVYLGVNKDFGASGFLRAQQGETAWEAAEARRRKP